MNYRNWTAFRHAAPAPAANATAIAGQLYRAIVWNTSAIADVIDSKGTAVKVVTVPGAVYPCQNYGVQTGGNTTVAEGDFVCLYD